MAFNRAKAHLEQFGFDDRIQTFEVSSATVELAAAALHTDPHRIAKTLAFRDGESYLLVITAGDGKIDNAKFKATFGMKARMLDAQDTEALVGHAVGGVCPFGVHPGGRIVLDVSMKRFVTVFPAVGSSNSAVELSPQELQMAAQTTTWVDVCKDWE
jgi:prolyl-tRNA editing enzyme YbaK/EbsC (Cys-tRNA(Pro) deacylase)